MPKLLAEREDSTIAVKLYWQKTSEDEITITVNDKEHEIKFVLHPKPEKAMDYFLHPFAYKSD